MDNNCFNCRFSHPAQDNTGKINFSIRICRQGPPVPVFVPTAEGWKQDSFHPLVNQKTYCHKHEYIGGEVKEGEESRQ